MQRFKFTIAALANLDTPEDNKTCEYGDTEIKPLHCRVRPSGHKSLSVTIKALVNHRIATNDVTGGYARITVERMREPMQKVTDYVLGYTGVKVDNVAAIG